MANHVSAEKRHRQSDKRRDRNRAGRTRIRSEQKKMNALIVAKDATAQEASRGYQALLDAAACKGLIHPNKAARLLSRAQKKLNAGR